MNKGTIMIIMQAYESQNREEKSLRHISMVAKFLDDNKPKKSLKSLFTLFQTSPIVLFGRGPNRVMETACFDANVQ